MMVITLSPVSWNRRKIGVHGVHPLGKPRIGMCHVRAKARSSSGRHARDLGQALEVGTIIRLSDLFVHVIHGPEFDADPALTRRTLR